MTSPRFTVEGKLATGALAELFSGRLESGETVVVKRPRRKFLRRPVAVQRFAHEVKLFTAFSHPKLIRALGSGEDERGPYLLLEHVDGRDLQEVLRTAHANKIPVPIAVSLRIVCSVAEALHYVHAFRDPSSAIEWKVVHGNVSPDEIVIGNDGSVRLGDFGVASSIHSAPPSPGSLFGKPSYMSPEQAAGQPTDQTSDTYACGILTYELTTGLRPFRGNDMATVLDRTRRGEFEPPGRRNPRLPQSLVNLIERTMSRDPVARSTAGQIVEKLGAETLATDSEVADFMKRLPPTPKLPFRTRFRRAIGLLLN